MELSSTFETDVNLPFITADVNGPKHLHLKITRTKLENLVSDLLDKLEGPCRMALKDAGLAATDIDEVVLVGGMTRMPAVQERVQKIFGKMPNKGVNPDEVVALGAAIQGAVLKGDVKDVLLLDVTPLSLGIETLGGVMTKLIERNTTIPARKSEIFTTAEDNQPAVSIHVLQGEREMAIDNKTLGRFELTEIAPAARGVPQIEVAFDIDANGIVEVSATNKATGKAQSIKITHSSGLSREDIDRLVKEAELHTEEDRHKRDRVEARNAADAMIHATEKSLVELGGKTAADERSRVEEAIANLKRAMDGADTGDIKRLTEELHLASQRLAAGLYQQSTAAGAGQDHTPEGSRSRANPTASSRDEEVVEAEYEEVD
jgi:molecular chaperone DnaK